MITAVTTLFHFITLVSDVVIVVLVLLYGFFLARNRTSEFFKLPHVGFFQKNAFLFSFIVSLTATLGSLFYSEIAQYEPCKLCWIQRIFMYPQVLIFGISLYKDDQHITDYPFILSLIGGVIALYHYIIQHMENPLVPCSVVGYSVSCTQKFTQSYGYITIPMMALTAFVLIILLMVISRMKQSKVSHDKSHVQTDQ